MPTFVQQALAGRPLTVFAGGGQERAFLSATDLARFITDHGGRGVRVRQADLQRRQPGQHDHRLEPGGADRRAPAESRSAIEHADARLIHGPLYEEAESIQKLPVLDAAAAVGWAPRITLDELIDETALYYRVRDDAREDQAVPLDPGVRV